VIDADVNAPKPTLRLLLVEDSTADATLILREIKAAGYAVSHEVACTAAELEAALGRAQWDIVISDYVMPQMDGLQALRLTKKHDPYLPFVVVSGKIGEETAVAVIRAGAQDYLTKNNLARLVPVIERELREVSMRRNAVQSRQALHESESRLKSILNTLDDIVWSVEIPSLRLSYLSPAAAKVYGRPLENLLGSPDKWLSAVHPEDRERMRRYIAEVMAAGSLSTEYRIVRPDGELRWLYDRARVVANERGCRLRIDGIASDITEHKRSQAMLYQAAHHDTLTGLPNRILLNDRLAQAIGHAQRRKQAVAVMFIDLDRFKNVNDGLGHEAGDALLRHMAIRIRQSIRAEDTVARLGGDEFVVVLPDIAHEADVELVANKLLATVAPAQEIQGHTIHCTASIGVALYPRDGHDAGALLKCADIAMYQAKQGGRNCVRLYNSVMNAAATMRLELENELREAIEQNQFELHYQPQVDLCNDGKIVGFEALVRWRHPRRGLLSPLEFIPTAEETGLIVAIGDWVLREACRQCKVWVDTLSNDIRMSVNISTRQLVGANLAQGVAAALAASGLPPKHLEIELTESLLMHDIEQSATVLGQLKAMGVFLAVDDFGTGYSSLAYLKRFPIDHIKIDRSFVRDISRDPDSAAICASIIAMAHALRLGVVAEGVETETQLGFLLQRQCQAMQGFLFSPPLPAEEATAVLEEGRRQAIALQSPQAPVRKLLLLDDEENILSSLKRLFRRDGYEIFAISDATSAFEVLAKHRVGVIVSDQRMPGMSGTEFLRRVKDLYPDTIRIVLSGYTELRSVTDAINEGAIYRFLTKPWDDQQLRNAIREAFQQQELASENARLDHQAREASTRLAQANEHLRILLAENSQRMARDATFLGIAQEAVDYVPLPIIGADMDGMVVLANAAAQTLLPSLAVGFSVEQALPAGLATCLRDETIPTPLRIEVGGESWWLRKQRMGVHSGSSGWLLILLPNLPPTWWGGTQSNGDINSHDHAYEGVPA
jgi:diguanylate cyclase (GGDEF)-like protein/PAS domain S-box-containing protein